jgi:hypothetical protein
MTPRALSIEPFLIAAAILFIVVILPTVFLLELKAPLRIRSVIVIGTLILTVFISFRLGRATGRSMAWYHWRSEYQDPLRNLQLIEQDFVQPGQTQQIYRIAVEFYQRADRPIWPRTIV